MAITESELGQIVAQATYLSERFQTKLVDSALVSKQQTSDELMARWCQVVAQGNSEKFHKRLLWDGLEPEDVLPYLSTQPVVPNLMPAWARTLAEIIETASEFTSADESKTPFPSRAWEQAKSTFPFDAEKPLPFEDVLLPALLVGRRRLLNHLKSILNATPPDVWELLSETAQHSLERSLLQRLVHICGKTLEFEFSRFRSLGQKLPNLVEDTQGTPNKKIYNSFVEMFQYEILGFLQRYPVLGRLIATVIDLWVEATGEFLQRLHADLSEIQQLFIAPQGEKLTINKVVEIKASLSDYHNRGRSVIALTFESGLKLVYKPKDLGLEVAYNQFLEWCNQKWEQEGRGESSPSRFLSFKILKVLNRGTYGWVEYVEQQPCEDEVAAKRFYQRAGMLLCLLYVLRGTDCHSENLIANGEHLVLIDMETLMHHDITPIEDSEALLSETAINQIFADSVLRIGLLPRWDFNKDNRIAYDISGLGGVKSQEIRSKVRQWQSVNTDDMHLAYGVQILPFNKNVPMLNGVPLSPNDYVDDIVQGFNRIYHFLIQQQQALLASDSPLAAFKGQQVRFVFRATKVYGVVLQKSFEPKALRNGVNRSIELDILSRAFLTTQEKPKVWRILHSEIQAMEQLDIPYFSLSTDSDVLLTLDSSIEEYFKESSYSQVISRLALLNEADLAQQVAIIRGAFYARAARTSRTEQGVEISAPTVTSSDVSLLTSTELLNHAHHIATEINSTAIWEESGSINWIGLEYIPNADRFQLQILDESLYNGNCGIALFLTAWERVTGSTQFRELATGALQRLNQFLLTSDPDSKQRFVRRVGIGGATGLGSIIYSLVKISQFRADTIYIDDAQRVASLITPELIKADRLLDVTLGAAGTIFGLLALYGETGSSAILDRARVCGEHLLDSRISIDNAPKAWKTFEEKPLTGFSHGAAGIAYALLRLYAVTQDSAYKDAAREAIAYESHVFSSASANWPDFRSMGDPQSSETRFQVSWCHGATGIGLARLGGLSILDTEEIRQDVEVALQTTQKSDWLELAQLCCGQFGRIELLLVAAEKLGREPLVDTARLWAAVVVARAEQSGFKLFPNLPNHVFSPSFFQGTAGIGYELLRLAYPEVLPSVLLWD